MMKISDFGFHARVTDQSPSLAEMFCFVYRKRFWKIPATCRDCQHRREHPDGLADVVDASPFMIHGAEYIGCYRYERQTIAQLVEQALNQEK